MLYGALNWVEAYFFCTHVVQRRCPLGGRIQKDCWRIRFRLWMGENLFFVGLMQMRTILKYRVKFWLVSMLALFGVQSTYAQDLEKLYKDSVRSKDSQKADEEDKNKKYLEWFDRARKGGVSWKCKNYFLFYDGYVLGYWQETVWLCWYLLNL